MFENMTYKSQIKINNKILTYMYIAKSMQTSALMLYIKIDFILSIN